MADTKTVAVVGATGAQGHGLVSAILEDPEGGFGARDIESSRLLNPSLKSFEQWLAANAARMPVQ